MSRIAQAVQRGAIEDLSVDEVAANVENACAVSQNSARTVARTIINGVSNAARIETLLANDDAIDGIEFLATLDARTSHICGALDGTVWRGDEMKRARRPPLHPNCRSTLIPVVDLVDPKTGEKIEETARRPARNANGSYSQVDAKTTFKDYFESQPESFQRSWLGARRFELWKAGKLKFADLAKPATDYVAKLVDLDAQAAEKARLEAEERAAREALEKSKKTPADDDNIKEGANPADLPTLVGEPRDVEKAVVIRQKALAALSEKRAVDAAKTTLDELSATLKQSLDRNDFERFLDLEAAVEEAGGLESAATTLGRELLRESRGLAARLDSADDWLEDEESDFDLIARSALKYQRGDVDRIAHVLARLTKEPFTPSKPIEKAADFTDVLQEFRVWKYGEERAKAKKKAAEKYAAERREYQKYRLSNYYDELEKKIAEARNAARSAEPGTPKHAKLVAERDALEAERDRARRRESALPGWIKADNNRRISGTNNADATHLLSILFPDRGGDDFFDVAKMFEVEKIFETELDELKGMPTRAFSRYNIIARHLKRKPVAPLESVEFADAKAMDGALGLYFPWERSIRLLKGALHKKTMEQDFAHEIGHWFEHQLLGPDESEAAVAWIKDKGGSSQSVFSPEGDQLEMKKSPFLLWNYWGYSATVYAPAHNDFKLPPPRDPWRMYKFTEVFSTGFEALLTDPEAFALATPDHFDYLVEAIKRAKEN